VKNTLYGGGFAESAVCTVRLSADGVEVISAATECGQGVSGVLAQVAAESFPGVPVRVAAPTSRAGYAGSSSASRQTWMSGWACHLAARDARAEYLGAVARTLGLDAGSLDVVDGCVTTADGRRLAFGDLLGESVIEVQREYLAPTTEIGHPDTGEGEVHVAWMFVAHRAVVDVDTQLGSVRVVQIATAQDVGRAINPAEVRGQILGGIAQGVGLALTEHLDAPAGVPVNASFTDYLVPTTADMPEVLIELVEQPEPGGPFGAKGAGEPASLSSTAAVAAAIRAATGRAVHRVPVRPDDLVL
jgi:CO/xanthine dehydrogenase Mo-binding subunit